MKTYYLGTTKNGAIVGRGSMRDYGYTHAAVAAGYGKGEIAEGNFSATAEGARKLATQGWRDVPDIEIVPVKVVTAAEYKAATGKR